MQDDQPPENDSKKNPRPFQFSLSTLFFWVTLSAIGAALFAYEQFILLVCLLTPFVASCVSFLLFGRKPHNRHRKENVLNVLAVIGILFYLLFIIALSLPAIQ